MQSFYNVFKLLGFVPGLEFKVAMSEAKKLKIPVVYGDQEASVRCRNITHTHTHTGATFTLTLAM
jgi:pheromone shutdown protein TraB